MLTSPCGALHLIIRECCFEIFVPGVGRVVGAET